jgi:hypothetical protein
VIGGAVGGALGFVALVAIGALIVVAVRQSQKRRRIGAIVTSTPSQTTPASVVVV